LCIRNCASGVCIKGMHQTRVSDEPIILIIIIIIIIIIVIIIILIIVYILF
jgi:uncharacterized protein (DUF983 family)